MIKVEQIKVTINEGIGGSRKHTLKRIIIRAIQKYMKMVSMYNKTAIKTIQFDIDIKVSFRKLNDE